MGDGCDDEDDENDAGYLGRVAKMIIMASGLA